MFSLQTKRNVSYFRLYKSNVMQWLRDTNEWMDERRRWRSMLFTMPTVSNGIVYCTCEQAPEISYKCMWCIRAAGWRAIYKRWLCLSLCIWCETHNGRTYNAFATQKKRTPNISCVCLIHFDIFMADWFICFIRFVFDFSQFLLCWLASNHLK